MITRFFVFFFCVGSVFFFNLIYYCPWTKRLKVSKKFYIEGVCVVKSQKKLIKILKNYLWNWHFHDFFRRRSDLSVYFWEIRKRNFRQLQHKFLSIAYHSSFFPLVFLRIKSHITHHSIVWKFLSHAWTQSFIFLNESATYCLYYRFLCRVMKNLK